MKSIKTTLSTIIFMFFLFLVLSLLITFLDYYNILNYKNGSVIKIIMPSFVMLLGGFKAGKKAIKNGWFEGIKLSGIISALLICITLFSNKLELQYFLYLLILMTSSILGSMVGINKKNT